MARWSKIVMDVIQYRPYILDNIPEEEWQKLDFFLEDTEKESDNFENIQWKLAGNKTFVKLVTLLFLYGDKTTKVPTYFAPDKIVQEILTLTRTEYLVSEEYEYSRPKYLSIEILAKQGYANISRDEDTLQTPTETASVLRRFKLAFIDNGKPKLLKKIKKGKGEA